MSAPSPRPEVLLDTVPRLVGDGGVVGLPGPFGRRRVVSCLPLSGGPRRVRPDQVVSDPWMGYLGDGAGVVLGDPGVVVSRIVDAGPVVDTRGLG